jgi:prolyl-tRNA editing enzyme YbaK/EbsC (Cys-tRNA(Pro) deacylase)
VKGPDIGLAPRTRHRAVLAQHAVPSDPHANANIGAPTEAIKSGFSSAEAFHLFVLSAARSVDSGAIRKRLNARRSRFATPEELIQLTGLVPGSIPPLGRPVLDLDLYVDEAMLANDRIAFNAGSVPDSIIMGMQDYLTAAKPVVFPLSRAR